MHPSRRSVLAALAALLAAPIPAFADDAERTALLAHVRDCLEFDVAEVIRRASADLRLPQRWVDRALALLEGHDTSRGFRSLAELDHDRAFTAAATALQEEASHALSMKLALLRAAKRAPATDEARMAALEYAFTAWFGLDLPRIRAHVATYEPGLLVVLGPARELPELFAAFAREPFVRFLELVHGRRATEWMAGRDDEAALYRALLDPAHRIVAFTGHGSWNSFAAYGFDIDPVAAAGVVCQKLRDDPRHTLPALLASDYRSLKLWPIRKANLTEPDLAALVAQWGGFVPKDLVVRYTCGTGRYRVEGPEGERLVWKLLPDELAKQVHVDYEGAISAADPDLAGTWEAPLAAWLADHRVPLVEVPALGTCLVADPTGTRGYEGISWTHHFVEDPVPAWSPPYAWPGPATAPSTVPGSPAP